MLLLVACGRPEIPPPPRTPVPPPAAVQKPAPARSIMSAATYVARASAIDLFEIQSAELALQRSGRGNIREFASMMIEAHKGTSAQLSLAGRRLNLLPSRALTPEFAAKLELLRAAPDFDSFYKSQQEAVHREALAIHQAYALRGRSPTLRPVAAAAVPVIQRHLRLLRYL